MASNAIPAKSIAVLPFQNLSPDNAGTFFADSVQDQIMTNLAKVSDLKVISHTSVQQYRNELGRNVREIGRELGVAYILEGTVQRAPGRVRVNAKLIDARTDSQIWAESYERDVADLFVIQSDLAQAIVNQLQAKLSPNKRRTSRKLPRETWRRLTCICRPRRLSTLTSKRQIPGRRCLKRSGCLMKPRGAIRVLFWPTVTSPAHTIFSISSTSIQLPNAICWARPLSPALCGCDLVPQRLTSPRLIIIFDAIEISKRRRRNWR